MTKIVKPTAKMTVTRRAERDKEEVAFEILEQEVPMPPEANDAYAQLAGDGKASVTVSREVSQSNFGTGGRVFVSITLTCHQEATYLSSAVECAKGLANHYAEQHWKEWALKLPEILGRRP